MNVLLSIGTREYTGPGPLSLLWYPDASRAQGPPGTGLIWVRSQDSAGASQGPALQGKMGGFLRACGRGPGLGVWVGGLS